MFVTQKKSKKEKKEIPCPADLVFLGDFTYVDYGREALTNYGRPNYRRTSLTIYGRETCTNYGRPNYGRTSRTFMGEIKRQKRERVVSVLYQPLPDSSLHESTKKEKKLISSWNGDQLWRALLVVLQVSTACAGLGARLVFAWWLASRQQSRSCC